MNDYQIDYFVVNVSGEIIDNDIIEITADDERSARTQAMNWLQKKHKSGGWRIESITQIS